MAFIPLTGGYRWSAVYDFAGEACQNSLWFLGPLGSVESVAALNGAMLDNWAAHVMPLLNPLVRLDSTVAVSWDTDVSPFDVLVPPDPVVGGQIGPCEANNVAFCLSLRTSLRGRSFRGRIYLPGISTNILADTNHVSVEFAGTAQEQVYEAFVSLAPEGFTPVVASFHFGGAPRAAGVGTPVINVIATDTVLDSMRRRLPGRGR
jgi:hypothetical protein